MKRSLTLTLAVLTVGFLAISTNAWAVTCTIKAYPAYQAAVRSGWRFTCMGSTFVPEHAFKAISCQGRTGFGPTTMHAYFFRHDKGRDPWLFNNWKLVRYWVTGGNFEKLRGERARVHFQHTMSVLNTPFKRRLTKIRVRKSGGVCARFLQEAF